MSNIILERSWHDAAREARSHRDSSLAAPGPDLDPSYGGKEALDITHLPAKSLTSEEQHITEADPQHLVAMLQCGKLTSVAVTKAYLRRAAVAQTLTNCVTELLPERALQRAAKLDKYFADHGTSVGPLHGLPVSVKEHLNMKGLDINAAFCADWGTVADRDAHLLKLLSDAGAVFYVRTMQPQTTMHLETANNLFGTTVNPFNRLLSAGGSSGGEGALLGLRGSCLGIGSDIGGSIRSPAANNGLFGFKPTAYRVPAGDLITPPVGEEAIITVYGPLSTTLAGIQLFMRVALSPSPWLVEPSLIPLPWREPTDFLSSKLKVAVMWDDGVVKPHPPIQRALRETVSKLREAPDVDLVDWIPHNHAYAWRLISSLYFCDGGETEKRAIARSGEPWLPLSRWILTENPYVRHLDVTEVWQLTAEREAYRSEYAKKWNETATGHNENGMLDGMVDVILCPVGPGAAPQLNTARWWGYTSVWNLLDYPALVVPTGERVNLEMDQKEGGYVPMNADDRYNWELYDPEKYVNAPLSLQIVGRRFEDEKVVQTAERLSKYCHFHAA